MTMARALRLAAFLAAASPLALTAQETQIHGFTDVGFRASDQAGDHGQFTLGQYVLHIMSRLNDRWSFMGETVFELDGQDFGIDVERVIVSYRASRAFQVAAGKHHTPIGYWNNAYHHGTLIQPTIARPLMFQFEDDGGIFPVHTTGLLLSGRDLGTLHLGYDLMIGNGIGSTTERDNNRAKSFTAAAHSQVTATLKVGVSAYLDRIAQGTPTLTDTVAAERLKNQIVGGFVALTEPRLELLGEYQHGRVQGDASGTHNLDAFYVYGGYRVGNLVGYGRYEEIHRSAGDPWYGAGTYREGLVGARYDFAATVTTKLELRRHRVPGLGTNNEVATQIAVGF